MDTLIPNSSLWDFEGTVVRAADRLTPLCERAAVAGTRVCFEVRRFGDLRLSVSVLRELLNRPQFRTSTTLLLGVTLPGDLPDSLKALRELTMWSNLRVRGGAGPIEVRLTAASATALEGVDSVLNGWPMAPMSSRRESATNYYRLLEFALRPEHIAAVRPVIASRNPFDLALAHTLAAARGIAEDLTVEMLHGCTPKLVEAVAQTVPRLRELTALSEGTDFAAAVPYLQQQLHTLTVEELSLPSLARLGQDERLLDSECDRFVTAVRRFDTDPAAATHRTQNRGREWEGEGGHEHPPLFRAVVEGAEEHGLTQAVLRLDGADARAQTSAQPTLIPGQTPVVSRSGFANEPTSDPALAANQEWAATVVSRAATMELKSQTLLDARCSSTKQIDTVIGSVRARAKTWGAMSGADRGVVLRRVALSLAANRDRFVPTIIAETGMLFADADREVNHSIDSARYYAARAAELDTTRGARFVPSRAIAVLPPRTVPISITAGGVLAALAAGSGAIVKPAPQTRHSAALLLEALWEAGIPRELAVLLDVRDGDATLEERDEVLAETAVLRFTDTTDLSRVIGLPSVVPGEGELGQYVATHPAIDRVLFTGTRETAETLRLQRSELRVLANLGGASVAVVTPSADIDSAVTQIVSSAFAYSGQDCAAIDCVILVGSVARSQRFLNRLRDAVASLRVGDASDLGTQVGPLLEPPSEHLWRALTVLEPWESWLVEPQPRDASGRLWSPGVRVGVRRGSASHMAAARGPVLNVMTALSLSEAIELQHSGEPCVAAALFSLDAEERGVWLDNAQAGNLFVNRATCGAMVERQPFGGWRNSSLGVAAKRGGPDALIALGEWAADDGNQSSTLHLRGLHPRVASVIEAAQPLLGYEEFDVLRRAALSDAYVWGAERSSLHDVSRLGCERNVLRHWPAVSMIRQSADAPITDLLRALVAALLVDAPLSLSVAQPLPGALRSVLEGLEIPVSVEGDADWCERVGIGIPSIERIRLLGGERHAVARSLGQSPQVSLWSGPVTADGRVELLPFVWQQSVSVAAHRYGRLIDLGDAQM